MGSVVLKNVPEDKILGREIMDTGVSMIGLGGDNVFCGTCGREIMHDMPIKTMKVNLLYRCDACGGINEVPQDS
ncbi:MAG: hypothetical protein HY055_05315 [Magnetospirillum sp.]|nr:hypothetical protein [Magnetospirillum sp.]